MSVGHGEHGIHTTHTKPQLHCKLFATHPVHEHKRTEDISKSISQTKASYQRGHVVIKSPVFIGAHDYYKMVAAH